MAHAQIYLQHGQRQQVLGEGQRRQEGSGEALGVEAHRAPPDQQPQHQPDAEEPHAVHGEKQPQRPAPVGREVPRAGSLPGQDGEPDDEQGIQAHAQVLPKVAHGALHPQQVQAAEAAEQGRHHEGPSHAAMQRRQTAAQGRHQLHHAARRHQQGEQQVQAQHGVADRVPRHPAGLPWRAAESRPAIGRGDIGGENGQPAGGREKPESDGGRHGLAMSKRVHGRRRRVESGALLEAALSRSPTTRQTVAGAGRIAGHADRPGAHWPKPWPSCAAASISAWSSAPAPQTASVPSSSAPAPGTSRGCHGPGRCRA
mmetsp:Transcript_23212/g.54895  ORF Transcript_23212/g.54895 Transcript_23212/m.54895 type:complete len:313 (-) Transcript_23212:323-1261(-)